MMGFFTRIKKIIIYFALFFSVVLAGINKAQRIFMQFLHIDAHNIIQYAQ